MNGHHFREVPLTLPKVLIAHPTKLAFKRLVFLNNVLRLRVIVKDRLALCLLLRAVDIARVVGT